MIYFNIKSWSLFTDDPYFNSVIDDRVLTKPISIGNLVKQKKRLPSNVKSVCYALSNINCDNTEIIYASHHGELDKSVNIIKTFSQEVSPAKFSLSVHNTVAGMVSIIESNNYNYNVIDSFSGAIEHAILDAVSFLSKKDYVLVIYYDEPFPEEIQKQNTNHYALVLLIEKGKDYSLEYSSNANQSNHTNNIDNFYRIIDFLLKKNKTCKNKIINNYEGLSWHWNCLKC